MHYAETIKNTLRDAAHTHGAGQTTAESIALVVGCSKATVQAWGRKLPPDGLIGPRWKVTYWRGTFDIEEREDSSSSTPSWFELPKSVPAAEKSYRSFDIGRRHEYVSNFVQACLDGVIALAPWQRRSVWTEEQQVSLLDSLIQGVSIGALTLWSPHHEKEIYGRPLPECKPWDRAASGAVLIVDGQQRATTLLKAALGELEHWRWNGTSWTRGPGFLTPRRAVLEATQDEDEYSDWCSLIRGSGDRKVARACHVDKNRVSRTDLDLMILGGSTAQMVETYRRLAAHGSPHSPEDLALMEAWAAENGVNS